MQDTYPTERISIAAVQTKRFVSLECDV